MTRLRLASLIARPLIMILLSLSLFWGGIIILLAKIPGWSLFFGLMMAPIGAILTIFTLDEVARNLAVPPTFKLAKCNVCGKTTYAQEDQKDVVCGHCREDLAEEIFLKAYKK